MKRALLAGVVLLIAAELVVFAQTRSPLLGIDATDLLFDDTIVQDLRLDMNATDWQLLKTNFRDNTYYPADFRWRDQVVRNIGIRSRGFGTRSPTKPGIRVDFNRFVGRQSFLDLKSLELKNNVTDPSNMRERISMLLFRRMGFAAPREATAKVFVNNDYVGVYSLVESVNEEFLQRVFGEHDGFLFAYNWTYPYYFGDRGTDPSAYVPLPFGPETRKDDPEPQAIVDLVQAINHSANFPAEMPTYLDLKKFMKQIAVESCLVDHDDFLGDFGMANFFLYRRAYEKQFVILPWDKSEAFTDPLASIFHHITDVPGELANQLMGRAIAMPELRTLYLDTALACARALSEPGTSDPRGWMEREIERENAQIRDAAFTDPVKPFSNGDYDNEVSRLTDFARRRGPIVTQEVNASR